MIEDASLRIIDTHAHLDMDDFDKDREDLLARTRNGVFPPVKGKRIEPGPVQISVKAMILPGITARSSHRVADFSKRFSELYPGAGIHPNHLLEMERDDWETIRRLASSPKTVAIGETGLDLYWKTTPIELQMDYLVRHSLLAKEYGLPIIIHCRDAEKELMQYVDLFRRWEKGKSIPSLRGFEVLFEKKSEEIQHHLPMKGVVHSYSGGPETALELIERGFYLGFTGSVTFGKKFAPIGEAAQVIPADRILLETDSPFLVPHPFRGKLDRNEPLMSVWTARRLAELRGVSVSEIVAKTSENACRLFDLP